MRVIQKLHVPCLIILQIFVLYDHLLLIQLSHFSVLVSTADAEGYVSRLRKGNGRRASQVPRRVQGFR